ncbi:hypothetical protein B0A55_05865 [Friedmanniomyces simplex]|uniref:Uncharacterized protein n=1 Tax=Friedmanniomyces simplex TaxID=329884 RepID=A0A4U0XB09_9PEZI|nr:hypothetical protein B0A55_05865 [Friedmanniomyces simplex]
MATAELRRSARLNTQDSNGRDHLAALMPGWTRVKFEGWITSPTVRPHLQFWYQLCLASRGRFNDVVDWINTGKAGYFHNPRHLEEDLLLMCLCEGSPKTHEEGDEEEERVLAKAETETAAWFTQELWARTAWRIVQANSGPGQAFEHMVQEVPAGAYGFVIEILCIAFHSIAFRGRASCYERLINGPACEKKTMYTTLGKQAEKFEDTEINASEELSDASTETSDHSSDLDFEESRRCISVRRVKLLEPRLKYDKNSYALRPGELRMVDKDGWVVIERLQRRQTLRSLLKMSLKGKEERVNRNDQL